VASTTLILLGERGTCEQFTQNGYVKVEQLELNLPHFHQESELSDTLVITLSCHTFLI